MNASLVLSQSEYTLLNFLVFMADGCKTKYSTKLLKQYNQATKRICKLSNVDKPEYFSSLECARNSFIGLIEKGYLIRLVKNDFMINPMVVYPQLIKANVLQDMYQEAINSVNVEGELSKMCNKFINGSK